MQRVSFSAISISAISALALQQFQPSTSISSFRSEVNDLLSDHKQKNAPVVDHWQEIKEEEEKMSVMIDARELMEGPEDDDHNRNFHCNPRPTCI